MTQLPDDHSAPASSSSVPETPPPAPQVSQGREIRIPQRKPGALYHFFHPPAAFPVLAQEVSIYTLWKEPPIIPDTFPLPPVMIGKEKGELGPWYMIRLIWKPSDETATTPWIDLAKTIEAFMAMREYADNLVAACTTNAPAAQQAQPVFHILHIRNLDALIPRFYRLRIYRLHHHESKEDIQQRAFNTRRVFVLKLQRQLDLLKEDPQKHWFPSTFEHYDRDAHCRGWMVISPVQALVAGVSTSVPRILANQLRRFDMNPAGQKAGIAPDRYEIVLDRISRWNSTEEIGETVDQLESLVTSGKKSIDGQVLLTLALALLGALIGLYVTLKVDINLLWISLLLLSIASLFFWIYARSGVGIWWRLGLLPIAGTLLLDTSPLWYATVTQFFLRLSLR